MHRTFRTSRGREQRYLHGQWEFTTDALDGPDRFPDDADRLAVPAAWNVRPEYYDHEGEAWYRRQIHVDGGHYRLSFQGICHDATVYVDGEAVADHYGGYTPFEAVLDLGAGDHEIVVRADNSRSDTSLPLPGTDWFPYGGITREVLLERIPERFVDGLALTYDLDGGRATVTGRIAVRNLGDAVEREVGLDVGGTGTDRTATIEAGSTTVDLELPLSVDRWTLADPTLYDVVATVGDDDYRDRIGFREIEITDDEILLNGESVALRGVNRHEDHPDFGGAQPLRVMEGDVALLERAEFNVVRGSHYPNHPRFLDLCDEAGVLFIEEIPYWQYDAEDFQRGPVLERGKQALRETIVRDRHHPSVFAWSVHNECYNHQPGVREATEELVGVVREHDDSRPVTLASNTDWRDEYDRCLELCDFICVNGYPGWYDDDADWASLLAGVREKYDSKPVVISEFGGGAVAGERTFEGQKWSESYQADLVADSIRTFEDTDYVVGWTIWQFCDTRTDPRSAMGRPKTKNNKGIVTEYRRPKDTFGRIVDLVADLED